MQMMSANAMDVFVTLFHKCCEQLAAPWKQNEPFSNPQCTIFVNIMHPLLELTQCLLQSLSATTFCFKDARLVQELFTLHKILCTKPPFGFLSAILTDIQEKIISLLVLFMQGTKEAPQSEEGIFKRMFLLNSLFAILSLFFLTGVLRFPDFFCVDGLSKLYPPYGVSKKRLHTLLSLQF